MARGHQPCSSPSSSTAWPSGDFPASITTTSIPRGISRWGFIQAISKSPRTQRPRCRRGSKMIQFMQVTVKPKRIQRARCHRGLKKDPVYSGGCEVKKNPALEESVRKRKRMIADVSSWEIRRHKKFGEVPSFL